MTMYRVTATLSQRELINYLDANGAVDVKIEVIPDTELNDAVGTSTPVRPAEIVRRKRGSRVVDVVLDRLKQGEAQSSDMRHALEVSGLSPNSLSTALAILQKDGRIKRTDGGSYELANAA